jgi:sugar O-acyltransferase (sialic acid O-acetyltransferase NeuD family)
MENVIIFGGKGTAVNLAEQIEDARTRFSYPMHVLGFAIDDPALGKSIAGFPVLSGIREAWQEFEEQQVGFLFALYRPDVMRERAHLLRGLGIPADRFVNFIHPLAYVARSVQMGYGNAVFANASLMHGVSLGSFGLINSGVVIEHDSSTADCTFLAAGAVVGSRVRIGEGAFVGLNANIREGVTVGSYACVGMGSVVLSDVATETQVYGVPAKARV